MRTGKNGVRRIAALVCAAALAASLLPAQVLAVDEVPNTTVETPTPTGQEEQAGTIPEGSGLGQEGQDPGTDDAQESDSQNKPQEGQQTGNASGDETLDQEDKKPAEEGKKDPQQENQKENDTTGANPSGGEDSFSDGATGAGEEVELDPTTLDNSLVSTLDDGDVAQIDNVTYATLDDAVQKAGKGATIKLLADCELTKGFNKTLTFTGGYKITINKQLTSDGESWMCFGLYDTSRVLTFDGVDVEWTSEVGTTPWLMMSLSGTLNVTNGANVTITVDSGSAGNRNAIYMNAGSEINVSNGSSFTIKGNKTQGKVGQGLQLDETGAASVNVTGGSTFVIDGTNRGYVNSPSIYVEDSTFTVQNCTANASNGGNFTAINSTVTYRDNAGHGLSADDVILKNTHFDAIDNGYYGIRSAGQFLIDGTSVVNIVGNSDGGDYAALKLTSGVKNGKVEKGAVVNITDNYCSALSNNGEVVFEEGVELTITGNANDQGTNSYGAGVYNTGSSANLTLPSDAVICNNHAKTGGDDIYSTGTITFGQTGSDWKLDGNNKEITTSYDCTDDIDGWYDDSKGARWSAHGTQGTYHVVPFEDMSADEATVTVTGKTIALKAAHMVTVEIQPAAMTIYMGGSHGYDGVLDDENDTVATNSLPEPGFYFTLPDSINDKLAEDGHSVVEEGQPADLSELIHLYVEDENGNTIRQWTLEPYGKNTSAKDGKYVYRLKSAENQDPVRLLIQDDEDNRYTSDEFSPDDSKIEALYREYTMSIYSGGVNPADVRLKIDFKTESTVCRVQGQESTLTVRYVTNDNQEDVVTGILDDIESAPADAATSGHAYAVAQTGTTYYINDPNDSDENIKIDVTDTAAPSLLFDDVVDSKDTGENEDYGTQLKDHALTQIDAELQNPAYQAKYLDLVDANNGNVWLTADKAVTVYWPYPDGTDENTKFYLVHFKGMNREMDNDAISEAISNADVEEVEILSTDAHGISFEADSFSPFVLVWDRPVHHDNPGTSTEQPQPTQTPKPTAAPATPAPTATPAAVTTGVIPSTGDTMPVGLLGGVAVVAAAALAALVVLRKRKHDD